MKLVVLAALLVLMSSRFAHAERAYTCTFVSSIRMTNASIEAPKIAIDKTSRSFTVIFDESTGKGTATRLGDTFTAAMNITILRRGNLLFLIENEAADNLSYFP